eukprot:355968-Chlamydomonas_euryale.AAC.4
MAKAILESAARARELGTITLNLNFAEPFWKLLLGIPLNLMDLQLLDPTEFRSLMSLLDMDIDGLIFENFTWSFHHSNLPAPQPPAPALLLGGATAGTSGSGGASGAATGSGTNANTGGGNCGDEASCSGTPTAAAGAAGSVFAPGGASASPFSGAGDDKPAVTHIPLKPGGSHLRMTNENKREYVLLKAHKMLVGTIEAQTTAVIDAFHTLIPRDLLDKYNFTSLEMQLLVCGEQRVDVQDLRRSCGYEDGYTGREDVIGWFWDVVEQFDDAKRRLLLQFWSGSDGMPAEGFGLLDPPFHMVAVDRMYDRNDTTARLVSRGWGRRCAERQGAVCGERRGRCAEREGGGVRRGRGQCAEREGGGVSTGRTGGIPREVEWARWNGLGRTACLGGRGRRAAVRTEGRCARIERFEVSDANGKRCGRGGSSGLRHTERLGRKQRRVLVPRSMSRPRSDGLCWERTTVVLRVKHGWAGSGGRLGGERTVGERTVGGEDGWGENGWGRERLGERTVRGDNGWGENGWGRERLGETTVGGENGWGENGWGRERLGRERLERERLGERMVGGWLPPPYARTMCKAVW